MSLWKSGDTDGSVSLGSLFAGNDTAAIARKMDISQLSHLICRGGWTGVLSLKPKAAMLQVRNYVDVATETDISRVDGISRNAAFARRLMRSYARHQGTQTPLSTLYADMSSHDDEPSLSEDTIASYLKALRKKFVIEDTEARKPNLRSKTAIRTSDTRHFADPSIATAVCGLGPNDLVNDLNTMGMIFETLCMRDLRIYTEATDGKVYHYRDKSGLECDAVFHLHNASYGLAEIKLEAKR